MNSLFMMLFASKMNGVIDQIYKDSVIVELSAKDGHTHETALPAWLFPCPVEEGVEFQIYNNKEALLIKCK
jgi:hypothetical protein|tara:strand:- start:616 stop:828 length:213 start_codon:yes stop_codon:yes gene_type:complete